MLPKGMTTQHSGTTTSRQTSQPVRGFAPEPQPSTAQQEGQAGPDRLE